MGSSNHFIIHGCACSIQLRIRSNNLITTVLDGGTIRNDIGCRKGYTGFEDDKLWPQHDWSCSSWFNCRGQNAFVGRVGGTAIKRNFADLLATVVAEFRYRHASVLTSTSLLSARVIESSFSAGQP